MIAKTNVFIKVLFHLVFGICTAVVGTLLLSFPLLPIFLKSAKLADLVNLSVSQIMANYRQLMCYMILPWVKDLKMNDFPSSVSGLKHFYEVKVLFQLVLFLFILGVAFLILQKKSKVSMRLNTQWSLGLMALPVVIAPFALMNFGAFFVFFHGIFFHNSDWLFDPATDPIINVLPENFFGACFVVFAVLYELYFLSFVIYNLIRQNKKAIS